MVINLQCLDFFMLDMVKKNLQCLDDFYHDKDPGKKKERKETTPVFSCFLS